MNNYTDGLESSIVRVGQGLQGMAEMLPLILYRVSMMDDLGLCYGYVRQTTLGKHCRSAAIDEFTSVPYPLPLSLQAACYVAIPQVAKAGYRGGSIIFQSTRVQG